MIAVVLKGIAGRKVRALLTAFAIVIGVSMVAGTFILTDTTQQSGYSAAAKSTQTTDAVVLENQVVKGAASGGRATIPAALVDQLRSLPGVADAAGEVSPQLEANVADVIGRNGRPVARQGLGRGLDTTKLTLTGANGGVYGPLKLESGTWAKGAKQVVLDRRTAAAYKLGDQVVVSAAGAKHTFTLTGTVSYSFENVPPRPSLAVWDIPTAQGLFDRKGRFDFVSVDAKPGTNGADLERVIKPLLPANLRVKSQAAAFDESAREWDHTIASIRLFLLAFGGVALLVGAFVIFNTLSITVAQRTRELATLRTLGASRRQVMRSVVAEGLVLGVIASAIGLVVGYGIAKAMLALVQGMDLGLQKGPTIVEPRTVVVAMVMGIAITLLASLVPARRATRVAPIAAVREGAVAPSGRLGWLVRPLVRIVGWPARRAGGTAGAVASANVVRHPGRATATAATLMIGLALVSAVGVLGASTSRATRSAVTDQIDADYVVAPKDTVPFAAAKGDRLAKVPGVTAFTHIRAEHALVQGVEREVSGVDPATIARFYRFAFVAGSLSALGDDGALVTERFATQHRLALGSRLSVTTPAGDKGSVAVRGIYAAPTAVKLLGDVTIGQQAFDAAFRQPKNGLTLLDADPRAAAALQSTGAGLGDVNVETESGYADAKTKDTATLVAILYVLLGFSIVVGLMGMVNTMVLSVFERTREIGMLRAVGMTRRQVRRMIRHESVITALMGAVLGLGLGTLLGAIGTALLPDSTALTIPWLALAGFAVVAVLAGLGAAVLPARRASRLNVLEAVAYE